MYYIQDCNSHVDNEPNPRYFLDGVQSLPLGRFMLKVCLLLVHWDHYPHPVDWHTRINTFDGILILLATNAEAIAKAQVGTTLPGLRYGQESKGSGLKNDVASEDGDNDWERRVEIMESVYDAASQIYTRDAGIASGLLLSEASLSWHSLRLRKRGLLRLHLPKRDGRPGAHSVARTGTTS